jgi:hypothetical protein
VRGPASGADDYDQAVPWDELVARIPPSCAAPRATPVGHQYRRSASTSTPRPWKSSRRACTTGKEYQMLSPEPARAPLTKEISSTTLTAAWTTRTQDHRRVHCKLRKKLPTPRKARTTSRPCGAAAKCASRTKKRRIPA